MVRIINRRLDYKSPCNPTVTHESNEPTHTVHVTKTYMNRKQTFDDYQLWTDLHRGTEALWDHVDGPEQKTNIQRKALNV